jgi:glycosyltransferase involved in cell wall biosynthesis
MRILVVSPVYPPYKGGMGAVAAQEVQLIREAGYAVRVVTPRYSNKPKATDENVELMHPIYSWGNGAILPWGELWQEIKKVDVVHLHYPFFGSALPVAGMARLAKKRLVVSWHMQARAEKHARVRRAIFFLHRFFEEPLIKRFAQVVCVSSQEYVRVLKLPLKKTMTVPFGIDDRRFSPGKNEAWRSAHGISSETCVVLFVGGMDRAHAFKGISVLLHAWAKLPSGAPARLLLVGDGDMRETYTALANALQIQDRVTFLGSVPCETLPEVYRAADVHVLPSVSNAEAYGLVTCEAGASGIPSIVSNLPGVRSLVDHEKTGVHVAPGNVPALTAAIERMAMHKEEREAWGSAAHKKITTQATLQQEQAALLRAYTQEGNVA